MLNIERIINEIVVVAMDLINNTDINSVKDVCDANANYDIDDKYAVFINFEPSEQLNYGLWFTFYEKNDEDGFNIEEQDTADLTEDSIRYNLNILLNGYAVKECFSYLVMNIEEIWGHVCSGNTYEVQKYFESGGDVNVRYTKFGIQHSLIIGALRNKQHETVKYLDQIGATILDHEENEFLLSLINLHIFEPISSHIFLASRAYSVDYEPVIILANCRNEAMEKAKEYFDTTFERGLRLESLVGTNNTQVYEIK